MKMENIDHRLSHGFADAVQRSSFTRKLADIAAANLLWLLGGSFATTLLFLLGAQRGYAKTLFVAVVASWVVTLALEYLIGRKRPFQELDKPLSVGMLWTPPSFPSGHATLSFAIATAIADIPHIGLPVVCVAYAIAATISAGRVAVRAHYVTDVLAGAVVGTVVTSLVLSFFSYLN